MTITLDVGAVLSPEIASSDVPFVERARALGPLIESEAEESERLGRMTPKVFDALRASGLYWMGAPTALGGGGARASEFHRVLEEIAAADASIGWAFMASANATIVFTGYLPEKACLALFGGPEKAIIAGMAQPSMRLRRVEGGGVLNGRGQFASGCDYATWIAGGFLEVDEHGDPVLGANGEPEPLWGVIPRSNVDLLGNWDVTGLRATGSQDYAVKDHFLTDDYMASTYSLEPVRSEGIFKLGMVALSVGGHAGVALGLCRRALHEVARITEGKVRGGYPTTVDRYPVFQFEFAKVEAEYQAARAYLHRAFDDAQDYCEINGLITPELLARCRQASTWCHHVAERVMYFARLWSGTQSFRNPSTLGRAVRDEAVLTQHLLIDNITLVDAAGPLLEKWRHDLFKGEQDS